MCRIHWLLPVIFIFSGFQAVGEELTTNTLKHDYPAGSYAYSHYSAGEGKGSAVIVRCPAPVDVAAELDAVVIRYTASGGPIAPGGRVLLTIPADCSAPQIKDGATTSTMRVETAVPFAMDVLMVYNSRSYNTFGGDEHRRMVQVTLPQGLPEQGGINFSWNKGRVSKYARGWDGGQLRFQVFVDHDADGYEEEIAVSPWVPVMTRQAAKLAPIMQSTAVVGEPVRLVVYVMDEFDNPALPYRGTVRIETDDPRAKLPAPHRYDRYDASSHEFQLTFSTPGYHWVTVVDETAGLKAESNPVEVLATKPDKQLYWGDLHVHTRMSADAANWVPSAVDYREAYLTGRYRAALDFQANADHHKLEQGNYTPEQWELMQRITNEQNDPGRFMTLVGMEVSHAKGDQNVYTAGDSLPFFEVGKHHPQDLWKKFQGTDILPIPHHFAQQTMRPWKWQNYDPQLMPVAEIYSTHGPGEFFGAERCFHQGKPTLEGYSWRDQLAVGRKIGAMASSDEHWGRHGSSGLVAVWATALERQPVLEQIRKRHCYASSNARAILHFTVNGQEMGEEISSQEAPLVKLSGATPTEILEIVLVKNGVEIPLKHGGGRTFDLAWTDLDFRGNAYYYVRVAMKGPLPNAQGHEREFIWSSPVWVTQTTKG